MKTYPSIFNSSGTNFRFIPNATIFDKLDGSNLRVEYQKGNWCKFGTRHCLFDESDEDFGVAIPLFYKQWDKSLKEIIKKERWQRATFFFEFWGKSSFAGKHIAEEPKHLTLFDVAPYKECIMGPTKFIELFGHLEIPRVIDYHNWNKEYVQAVWDGKIDVTFEGVVAKAGHGHALVMAKAKTRAWIEKVKNQYLEKEAQAIINS